MTALETKLNEVRPMCGNRNGERASMHRSYILPNENLPTAGSNSCKEMSVKLQVDLQISAEKHQSK
jgi:hypothetical protein